VVKMAAFRGWEIAEACTYFVERNPIHWTRHSVGMFSATMRHTLTTDLFQDSMQNWISFLKKKKKEAINIFKTNFTCCFV
jgi:hypothetical protein